MGPRLPCQHPYVNIKNRPVYKLNFADLSRDAAMPQATLQRCWPLFNADLIGFLLLAP